MDIQVGVNSFISLEDAEKFFEGRLYSEPWNNADATTKQTALIHATRNICKLNFKGLIVDRAQKLPFPRAYQSRMAYGWVNLERKFNYPQGWYQETSIPQQVLDACCEEAIALIEFGDSARRKLQQQGVKNASIQGNSEQYADWAGRGLISGEARNLLKNLIAGHAVIV